jgi:hypothetical protein
MAERRPKLAPGRVWALQYSLVSTTAAARRASRSGVSTLLHKPDRWNPSGAD